MGLEKNLTNVAFVIYRIPRNPIRITDLFWNVYYDSEFYICIFRLLLLIIVKSEVSTFHAVVIFFLGCVYCVWGVTITSSVYTRYDTMVQPPRTQDTQPRKNMQIWYYNHLRHKTHNHGKIWQETCFLFPFSLCNLWCVQILEYNKTVLVCLPVKLIIIIQTYRKALNI